MTYTFRAHEGEVREGSSGSETVVALCRGISFTVETNTEAVFELGSRTNKEYKRGNLEITGTIDRLIFDNRFFSNVDADHPVERTIVCYASGSDGTTMTITLSGVVFTSWDFDMPAEDYITESVEFTARDITFS